MIRSLVARSGKRLRVLGMPALKEWQEMELIPGVQMSARRWERVILNWAIVRFLPFPKRNTGKEGS